MVVRIGQRKAKFRPTWFREWRKYRKLTQAQLADKIGTTITGISNMETGRTTYSQSTLEAWALALDCEPTDLISGPPGQTSIDRLFRQAAPETQRIIKKILSPGE